MAIPPVLVDVILVGVFLEAVGLALWLRRAEPTLVIPMLLFLGSGGSLILAVRVAMMQEESGALLSALLLFAGGLHVLCLRSAIKKCR